MTPISIQLFLFKSNKIAMCGPYFRDSVALLGTLYANITYADDATLSLGPYQCYYMINPF